MHYFITFAILYSIWLIFSGLFDAFHMTLGLISCLIVTFTSTSFLFQNQKYTLSQRLKQVVMGLNYSVWLTWQIYLSNVQVFKIALSPRMMEQMDPQIFVVKTRLKSDFAKFILANSITLTPGTVTIKIDGDEMLIHSLSKEFAVEVPGNMENRVAAIFGEVLD